MTQEAAEQVCKALVAEERRSNCVQDVMVTGEATFATTYLASQQIERNEAPPIPGLIAPVDNASLGGSIRFTWNRVRDTDNDPVTYRHCVWSISEGPNNNKCEVVGAKTEETGRNGFYALLIGCIVLLLAVLITRRVHRRPLMLALVAIVVVAGVLLVYRFVNPGTDSTTVAKTVRGFESGQIYYWKVIADDGRGASPESETRMIQIKE